MRKLRIPSTLLTSRFKKLAAAKQAQEKRLLLAPKPCPSKASRLSPTDNLRGSFSIGCFYENDAPGSEDGSNSDWASMAEEGPRLDGDGGGGDDIPYEGDGSDERLAEGGGQGHLMLVCRALLLCSTSKTESVRTEAISLLAEADIPGVLDALQVPYYEKAPVYNMSLFCRFGPVVRDGIRLVLDFYFALRRTNSIHGVVCFCRLELLLRV